MADTSPNPPSRKAQPNHGNQKVAVVLSGGGARAAYQVGMLRCLAKLAPDYRFDIVTGVSAGAINAAFLAAHPGGLGDSSAALSRLWEGLTVSKIFEADGSALLRSVLRWGVRLISGGGAMAPEVRGMVDTKPLAALMRRELDARPDGSIPGIARNIERDLLEAVALTTINYTTGETVTWYEADGIEAWERPSRHSERTPLTVEHIMASAALPLLFPAIQLADGWHGDGGIRLSAPLSPAVHLGAEKIVAISTRYHRDATEAEMPIDAYPPPAQIIGKLMNAIFLDIIDQDVHRLRKINHLLHSLPEDERGGMREIECLVVRPSVDLGKLASQFEPQLPKAFRFLTRSLGTRETSSPDFLSLLMFQPDYLKLLIEIGENDADQHCEEIARMVIG